MDIFEQVFSISPEQTDSSGRLTLPALLTMVQNVSGSHSDRLGLSWEQLQEKGLFWAVLRHRLSVSRLPRAGQSITLRTWPTPTTRTAYPRVVQGLDEQGNVLFAAASLWVLMDRTTRAMVLPGKSGVTVPGFLTGAEPALPGSLQPQTRENRTYWQIAPEDLDQNCHVNNVKYLAHGLAVTPLPEKTPHTVTVCYLAESRLGQQLELDHTLSPTGELAVDGYRRPEEAPEKRQRIFSLLVEF